MINLTKEIFNTSFNTFMTKIVRAFILGFYVLKSSFSLILGVFGLIYLIHSSVSILRWFLSERWVDLQSRVKLSSFCSRYPQSCFSPTELKNFLARVQSTEPHCTIQVRFLLVLVDLCKQNFKQLGDPLSSTLSGFGHRFDQGV